MSLQTFGVIHTKLASVFARRSELNLEDGMTPFEQRAASRTMSRADYSALSPAVTLNNLDLTGTGGNADLKPIRSTNGDGALEWYFAAQSILSVGVFYMDSETNRRWVFKSDDPNVLAADHQQPLVHGAPALTTRCWADR